MLIIEKMKVLLARRILLALAVTGALVAGSAGAAPPTGVNQGAARAYSVRILIPGQPAQGTGAVTAPPDAVALGGTFSYPADGSIVSTESLSGSASTDVGVKAASARATSEAGVLRLFGGEISATRLFSRAIADARQASGSAGGSTVAGLTILGEPVDPAPNTRVQLGDWGSATLLERVVEHSASPGRKGVQVTVAAVDVLLTQDHGGLTAGSQILVAYSEASAHVQAPQPQPLNPPPAHGGEAPGTAPSPQASHSSRPGRPKAPAKPPEPKPSPFGPELLRPVPHHGRPKLAAGPYVFPVFGPSSFTNSYGSPRADVGWHHGDDIFAPLGAPVLAVARGVVYSVGWNELGGNRLWLKDGKGNQFYYAHLSAYSPLAVNGGRVSAGDVLGFVGNTGDAISTPYHLHFEIHPVSLLYKGYDGVVDPTSYLSAWRRLRNLGFSGGFAGKRGGGSSRVVRIAPQPGAILLRVADISSASGLDREAIKVALAAGADLASGEGQVALLGLTNRG